jgi:hypothetical protein
LKPESFVDAKMFFLFGRLLGLLIRADGVCPTKIDEQIWQFVLRPHTMTDEAVKKAYENHYELHGLLKWIDELKPYVDVDLSKVEELKDVNDWSKKDLRSEDN